MGKVTLPTPESNPGKAEWSEVYANDKALREAVNGGIDNENIKASAGIEDSKLASPNNSVYRVIHEALGTPIATGKTAGNYLLAAGGGTTSGVFISSGELPYFYFDAADFAVGGKTLKLRVRGVIASNSTPPNVTITVGLYPLTIPAEGNAFTLGSVVSGSTTEIVKPAASKLTPGVSGDFAAPSSGAYVIGAALNGTLAAAINVSGQLQIRHV